MSKIEINNEIVLMRHIVRKARLHIIRRLIKQVKLFGGKKGDEKHKEKYKRKADKLVEELIVIKKLKEDEISRYSIKNERTLEEVLANEKSDAELRVLARLASHKIILGGVAKFKEKFPNYDEHLGPGKRKLIKLKRKAGKIAKRETKIAQISGKEEEKEEQEGIQEGESNDNSLRSEEIFGESLPHKEESNEQSESAGEAEKGEEIKNSKRQAETNSSGSDIKRMKTTVKNLPRIQRREEKLLMSVKSKNNNLSGIRPASKEATVKSFARFLEEKNENNSVSEASFKDNDKQLENEDGNKIELEKEVDSFFMTEDGVGEYLSVVVPKSKLTEDDDEEGAPAQGMSGGNFSRSRNNRFFDKVDSRFDNTKRNNTGRDKTGFVRGDGFKDRNESRGFNNNNNNRKINESGMKTRGDFPIGNKSTNDNNMHPSWAAKKKQQEILKLGFQGKKIVFDDV